MSSDAGDAKPRTSFLATLSIKLRQVLFPGSQRFWETRYALGGDSGNGSYGKLAAFKAEVINGFVQRNNIQSVIEFGCGDGNQLALGRYPKYTGLDVSASAIARCHERFRGDAAKSFFLYSPFHFVDRQGLFRAELALSLDVIYHLVEDAVFETYLTHLFASAEKYVLVYSSNSEKTGGLQARHVRHRHVTRYIEETFRDWRLVETIPNRFPGSGILGNDSCADFFIFEFHPCR